MAEKSWQLRQEDRLVGTLPLEDSDMFWSECRFEPAPAWDDLRSLFATSRDARERGDEESPRQPMRRPRLRGSSSFPTEAAFPSRTF